MFSKKLNDSPEFEAGDLTILREVVHPLNDNLPIGYSLAQARLPIGEASLPHSLVGSELYYILQGKGRLFVNEESAELLPGDTALVPARASQYIENIGADELVFLCMVDPYWTPDDETIA